MKTTKNIFTIIALISIFSSCASDPQAKLSKLKKQQADIEEKIRILESEQTGRRDSLDTGKFRLVGITEVTPLVFDHYIRVQGKLDGDQNTSVSADVPGTVKEVYAAVGRKVSQGQTLAQIDDAQLRIQLGNLNTQYRFAADMYEKQKRLWDQKIGSEVQFLQSKTNKESLEQQISVMEEQIGKFKIKSPVNGTIEEANVKPGSVVSPDPRSVAFRIVGFKQLKVAAEVSEAYSAKVNKGDKVIVLFPDLDRQVESAVDFVSSYIDPVNRIFMIESAVKEFLPGMKANMVAIVKINDYHSDSSLQVPVNVILKDINGSYVFVARKKDNHYGAFRQYVVIGNTYNGMAEILQGLNTSDKVITTGYQDLIDGEYVRFEKPAEAYLGN